MNVSNAQAREQISRLFLDAGFGGDVFKQNGYRQKATAFAKKRIALGGSIEGMFPDTHLFDVTSQRWKKQKSVVTVQDKLRKKFKDRDFKFNKRQGLIYKTGEGHSTIGGQVAVTYEVTYPNGERETHTTTYDSSVKWKPNGRWKQTIRDAIENKFRVSGNIDILNIEATRMEMFPKTGATGMRLQDVRLQSVAALLLDGEPQQPWDTGNNQCVPDFLRWYYGTDKNLPNVFLTDETFDDIWEPNWREEGVSTTEIGNWCKAACVKMIALDSDENLLVHHQPDREYCAKRLTFVVTDKHIHPKYGRENTNKFGIIHSDLVSGMSTHFKRVVENQKHEERQLPCTFITKEERSHLSPTEYMCLLMVKTGTKVNSKTIDWGPNGPNKFILDGKKYVFHDIVQEPVKKFYDSLNKSYSGETSGIFVKSAMDAYKMRVGNANAQVNDLFAVEHCSDKTHLGGPLVSYHRDTPSPEEMIGDPIDYNHTDLMTARTFDVNKCHTSILENPVEEWLLPGFYDQLDDYDHLVLDEKIIIHPGHYWVETDDKTLFMGNKWYSSAMVEYAFQEKIITPGQVKYQVLCGETLDRKYFHGLFDVYKKYSNSTPEGVAFTKLLCNTTSGMLGKKNNTSVSKRITSDIHEAFEYLFTRDHHDPLYVPVKFTYNDVVHNFYTVGQTNKKMRERNNWSMYSQILDQQAIKMHQFIKHVSTPETKVLYRRSDAVTLTHVNSNNLKDCISVKKGMWKEQKNPQNPKYKKYTDSSVDWDRFKQGWNINHDIQSSNDAEKYIDLVEKKQSLLTIGEAGCGKSHIIHTLRQKYKCLLLAFSNCAARRIRGQTIHSALNINPTDKTIGKRTLGALIKNPPDCVILDEYGIVTGELWGFLHQLKKSLPNTSFFGFGDCEQLDAIGSVWNTKIQNHSTIMRVFNYQRTNELVYHEKCRMSPELRTLLAPLRKIHSHKKVREIWEDNIFPTLRRLKRGPKEFPLINVCYTNKYKDKENIAMNKRMYNLCIEKNLPTYGTTETEDTTWYLHSDQPFICQENLKVLDLYNGQRFRLLDYDEERGAKLHRFSDNEVKIVAPAVFRTNFDLGYFLTNHKIIGETFKEPFCIHQTEHPAVDRKWLYTVCSRATKIEDIIIFS